jgi:hypothetical protein
MVTDGDFMELWEAMGQKASLLNMLEDHVFLTIYERIFQPDEDEQAQNQKTKDKLRVLREIISPELLQISPEAIVPYFYRRSQKEFQRIPGLGSPRLKLSALLTAVADITSKALKNIKEGHLGRGFQEATGSGDPGSCDHVQPAQREFRLHGKEY